jgi:hypothetical protein
MKAMRTGPLIIGGGQAAVELAFGIARRRLSTTGADCQQRSLHAVPASATIEEIP